jgi:ACS family tartrate transporter-like MFS transporter
LFFFFVGICAYGFSFSAPTILKDATGWSVGMVGWVMALFGLLGAVAMLLNGVHSDHRGERASHGAVPCCITAAGFLVACCAREPWLIVTALAASSIATNALWGPALSVPMEFLAGRAAAAGIAAMNTIAICSGFVGPYWMGLMRDSWGNYDVGLLGLMVAGLAAAAIFFRLVRSLAKKRPSEAASPEPIEETV